MALVTDGCTSYAIIGYVAVKWGAQEGAKVSFPLCFVCFVTLLELKKAWTTEFKARRARSESLTFLGQEK